MNAYFKFGANWEQRDIDWLKNFFSANPLATANLAAAGFALGRRPDSIAIKMVKEGLWKSLSNGGVSHEGRGVSQSALEWFRNASYEEALQQYPERLSTEDVEAYYRGQAPKGPSTPPPDDRVLYVCHDGDRVTAASFKWVDVADVGVTEKRVVDMSVEAAALWAALPPDVQAVLRAAVKEGKV